MLIEIRGGPHAAYECDVEDEFYVMHRFFNNDGTVGYYYVFIGFNEDGLPIYQYSAKD